MLVYKYSDACDICVVYSMTETLADFYYTVTLLDKIDYDQSGGYRETLNIDDWFGTSTYSSDNGLLRYIYENNGGEHPEETIRRMNTTTTFIRPTKVTVYIDDGSVTILRPVELIAVSDKTFSTTLTPGHNDVADEVERRVWSEVGAHSSFPSDGWVCEFTTMPDGVSELNEKNWVLDAQNGINPIITNFYLVADTYGYTTGFRGCTWRNLVFGIKYEYDISAVTVENLLIDTTFYETHTEDGIARGYSTEVLKDACNSSGTTTIDELGSVGCQFYCQNLVDNIGTCGNIANEVCADWYSEWSSIHVGETLNSADVPDTCVCHLPAEVYTEWVDELYAAVGFYIPGVLQTPNCMYPSCILSPSFYYVNGGGSDCTAVTNCINSLTFNSEGDIDVEGSQLSMDNSCNDVPTTPIDPVSSTFVMSEIAWVLVIASVLIVGALLLMLILRKRVGST